MSYFYNNSSWKVGSGESIKVYGDKWVGCNVVNRLRGVEGTVAAERTVYQLMSEDGEWREEVLSRYFNVLGRDAIKTTERMAAQEPDQRWWTLEATGQFSVKSCYRMGFYRTHDHMSNDDRKVWGRVVWQVTIPPKAQVFLWRACMNIILTMGNLREHHVPVEGVCPLCCDRWATTVHMLLFCPKVRRTWKNSSFWRLLKGGKDADFLEIAIFMERELEEDEYVV